ncbi:MAG: hypothetical protein HYY01_13920 [Chloroflexi bacterium]|nr:hypothetical protein [Chloroflexota bacterium]
MNRSTGPARPPRYEQEIEKVLRRSRVGRARRRWRMPRLGPPAVRWDWQTGALLGWALALTAFMLHYVSAPWAFRAARWLVLGAFVLLVLGYLSALFPRRPPHYEKRWRGEVIDLPPPEPVWRQALRRLFRR